eukprot:Rmarinus@m.9436
MKNSAVRWLGEGVFDGVYMRYSQLWLDGIVYNLDDVVRIKYDNGPMSLLYTIKAFFETAERTMYFAGEPVSEVDFEGSELADKGFEFVPISAIVQRMSFGAPMVPSRKSPSDEEEHSVYGSVEAVEAVHVSADDAPLSPSGSKTHSTGVSTRSQIKAQQNGESPPQGPPYDTVSEEALDEAARIQARYRRRYIAWALKTREQKEQEAANILLRFREGSCGSEGEAHESGSQ